MNDMLTNNAYVISDIEWMLDVNDAILVPSLYVPLHIRRLLRDEIAEGTLKPRRLATLGSQVCHQAVLRATHGRTIHAGKSLASVRFPRAAIRVSRQFEGCTET